MTTTAAEIGQLIPDMTLVDDEGTPVSLRALAPARVVLYFYPKDATPGCTTQACALRDSWEDFAALADVVIYGVSPDPVERHERFRAKHDLPFHLLVDEEHRLADALGFWVEKHRYGRTYFGVERSTVVLDAGGRISAMRRAVRPAEHTDWLRSVLTDG